MAYATVAQVAGEFSGVTFGADTKVTEADVTRFLDEASAEIDAALCQRYVVPITGTTSLLLMRRLCLDLVSDPVRMKLGIKTGDARLEQENGKTQADKARDRLKKIQDGTTKLPDADTSAAASGGIASYAVEEDQEPVFDRDYDQW